MCFLPCIPWNKKVRTVHLHTRRDNLRRVHLHSSRVFHCVHCSHISSWPKVEALRQICRSYACEPLGIQCCTDQCTVAHLLDHHPLLRIAGTIMAPSKVDTVPTVAPKSQQMSAKETSDSMSSKIAAAGCSKVDEAAFVNEFSSEIWAIHEDCEVCGAVCIKYGCLPYLIWCQWHRICIRLGPSLMDPHGMCLCQCWPLALCWQPSASNKSHHVMQTCALRQVIDHLDGISHPVRDHAWSRTC